MRRVTMAMTGRASRCFGAATVLLLAATGFAVADQVTQVTATAGAVPTEDIAQGEALYLKNCRLCHGSKGTSGKPLKQNENLSDGDYVAGVILTGPGYMTPFAEHLSDEEIALIATYVRNSWGNAYGAVAPQDVASLR